MKSDPSATSELEFEVELGAAWRIGGDGLAEEWGCDHADEGDVVGMIQDIERVDGDGEGGEVFLFVGFWIEGEVVREVEIEIDEAGAVEGIAREAGGAIVNHAVTVVVGAGSDVHRLAGIQRERGAEGEEIGEMR